ncbi:DUF397 domain-containing protein [Actinomadura sp. PM05-2]|uniref:DUF397 domain-containing protein n=2 Tax=Actinomadura parmotrematis TaxID=2864039 RepID=A0ABS7FL99_9ACTN|nr:DUF397 domain-containing protein [Actinomadura parmotrematis]
MKRSGSPPNAWRKSSHSTSGAQDCVEVTNDRGLARIRDSKDPHGPTLPLPHPTWAAFLDNLKAQ